MPFVKSIASVLSFIALGFGLLSCSGGGGGGGGSTSAFAVSTTAADFGVVDNTYTSTLATTGGTAPFAWAIFGGVLPNGLSLNAGMGVVSGTPDTAGTSTVDFTVTDSTGRIATGSVLFAIHPRTDRISVNGSGTVGNGFSSTPSINGDGNLVAFVSLATNLLAPAIPAVAGQQVYVHNRLTNQIELISRDNSTSDVNEGNGVSSASVISADGRYVAFVSAATNLLAPGTPAVPAGQQIYVRDRQTGLTSLVSVDNNGTPLPGNGVSSDPSISGDGRYVVFVSAATNLLAPGTPGVPAGQQIYVRDRQTGLTSLVSVDNDVQANPGNDVSSAPSISADADGRYVAFVSAATNLLAPGTPAVPAGQQIYVRDRQTGLTSLVSVDNNVPANPGIGLSSAPSISVDGHVAFVSQATNLLAPGTPAVPAGQQIYVRDRQTGLTSLVSVDNNVPANPGIGLSSTPSISGNGRYVSFVSLATNLLAPGGPAVAGQQIYIRDHQLGQSFLVSQNNTNTNVAGAGGISDTPSTNSDGGFVAFFSQATNLVTGLGAHIYVRAVP